MAPSGFLLRHQTCSQSFLNWKVPTQLAFQLVLQDSKVTPCPESSRRPFEDRLDDPWLPHLWICGSSVSPTEMILAMPRLVLKFNEKHLILAILPGPGHLFRCFLLLYSAALPSSHTLHSILLDSKFLQFCFSSLRIPVTPTVMACCSPLHPLQLDLEYSAWPLALYLISQSINQSISQSRTFKIDGTHDWEGQELCPALL